MHDFDNQQNPIDHDDREPLAGSGLESEEPDSEFTAADEIQMDGGEQ